MSTWLPRAGKRNAPLHSRWSCVLPGRQSKLPPEALKNAFAPVSGIPTWKPRKLSGGCRCIVAMTAGGGAIVIGMQKGRNSGGPEGRALVGLQALRFPRMLISRRVTPTVTVGGVTLGSSHPIVVQSMTNTDTADADSTARQVADLAAAGSELVRVTVNNEAAAATVPLIVGRLEQLGVRVPLIGDFHYNGH